MEVRLLSHVNADGDLLAGWFRYYLRLGISKFHLIVHGSRHENRQLYELKDCFPMTIEDSYEAVFDLAEKKRRLDSLLRKMAGRWVVLVDSDEFVEFPFRQVGTMVRMLELAGANVLYAPMLQRVTRDGSLQTPDIIDDPFDVFPLCSPDLYRQMGSQASIHKYPLFYCAEGMSLSDGGNHNPPTGNFVAISTFRGVTHHFKFRRAVAERLQRRINSSHAYRHESVGFQAYLEQHDFRVPVEGAFFYSRRELFRRRLLRRFSWHMLISRAEKVLKRSRFEKAK